MQRESERDSSEDTQSRQKQIGNRNKNSVGAHTECGVVQVQQMLRSSVSEQEQTGGRLVAAEHESGDLRIRLMEAEREVTPHPVLARGNTTLSTSER